MFGLGLQLSLIWIQGPVVYSRWHTVYCHQQSSPQSPWGGNIGGHWWTDSRVLVQVYSPKEYPWSVEAIHQQHYLFWPFGSYLLSNYGLKGPPGVWSHRLIIYGTLNLEACSQTGGMQSNDCNGILDCRFVEFVMVFVIWAILKQYSVLTSDRHFIPIWDSPQYHCKWNFSSSFLQSKRPSQTHLHFNYLGCHHKLVHLLNFSNAKPHRKLLVRLSNSDE